MASNERIDLTQEQVQIQTLSPIQVQFVRVLGMSGPAVEEEVRCALQENPALEKCEDGEDSFDAFDREDSDSDGDDSMMSGDYSGDDDYSDDDPIDRYNGNNHSADDTYYTRTVVAPVDGLVDSLDSQLGELDIDDRQKIIGEYIVGNIDNSGYMTRQLQDIADDMAFQSIDVSVAEVKYMFDKVRTLEPAGIGAVDLRDCLLLQLCRKEVTHIVKIATEMVKNYFDLYSKKHYETIRRQMSISEEELLEADNLIKSLNPKPGSVFGGGSDQEIYITPDFRVEVDDDEVIHIVALNRIPELQIESSFSAKNDEKNLSRSEKEAQAFRKRYRDEASTFIQVLKMRQQTLMEVMTAIVKIQREFFLTQDERHIRPMILKDINELTGKDLSVISRATSNKYVEIGCGTYPLKFFFNERPKDDDDASLFEIKAKLQEIIDGENKKRPLCDEAISKLCEEKGYRIARRTVAKYREQMGIPVARWRKQIKG